MSAALSLQIDSDLESVELVARAVRALCSDNLDESMLNDVELSVVEAVNNVIKHGYHGKRGSSVEIKVGLRSDRVVIDILDQAPPMPEGVTVAKPGLPFEFDPERIEDLPEGGMGLALIQMTMDEVSYSSEAGVNRLTLTKLFAGQQR
jgi:serine/threonine-protein kinase RsbW